MGALGLCGRGDVGSDTSKLIDQPLCERFRVDARDCERQQIFDELVVVKTCRPGVEQPLSKARAMTGALVRFI